jgi:hypothetical protein
MGYYTEFKFKAKLSNDIPENILDLLNKIISGEVLEDLYQQKTGKELPGMMSVNDIPNLPIEHEFGKCPRWNMLFNSNPFNPENIKSSKLEENELTIHTEFKNYDGEIEKFIDWIRPFTVSLEAKSKGEDSEYWIEY